MKFVPGARTARHAALEWIRLSDQIRVLGRFGMPVPDGLLRALREADADLTAALTKPQAARP